MAKLIIRSTILSVLVLMSRSDYSSSNNILVPSLTELKMLKDELHYAFDTVDLHESTGVQHKPLAGGALRLTFHDCGGPPERNNGGIGKCDGCVEMDNFADHAGLESGAINPLDDIYLGANKWNYKMSRSDFWAFAGTVAILHTRDLAPDNDIMPKIPFFFGREDCETSPDLDGRMTETKPFPKASGGWKESFKWMNTNFGMNVVETVAILGAHTIGRTHPDASGYTGPWVGEWGHFDNGYYKDILQGSWFQRSTQNGRYKEWTQNDESSLIMLNADMALCYDLDNQLNTDTGEHECGRGTNSCSPNTATIDIVQDFANNNQWFLNAFVPAYIKMITTGYDVNKMITVCDGEIEDNYRKNNNNYGDRNRSNKRMKSRGRGGWNNNNNNNDYNRYKSKDSSSKYGGWKN